MIEVLDKDKLREIAAEELERRKTGAGSRIIIINDPERPNDISKALVIRVSSS